MIALLEPLLPYIAAIVAALGWGAYQRRAGAKSAETKQKAKERDSYEAHLRDIERSASARPSGSVSEDHHNRDRFLR